MKVSFRLVGYWFLNVTLGGILLIFLLPTIWWAYGIVGIDPETRFTFIKLLELIVWFVLAVWIWIRFRSLPVWKRLLIITLAAAFIYIFPPSPSEKTEWERLRELGFADEQNRLNETYYRLPAEQKLLLFLYVSRYPVPPFTHSVASIEIGADLTNYPELVDELTWVIWAHLFNAQGPTLKEKAYSIGVVSWLSHALALLVTKYSDSPDIKQKRDTVSPLLVALLCDPNNTHLFTELGRQELEEAIIRLYEQDLYSNELDRGQSDLCSKLWRPLWVSEP